MSTSNNEPKVISFKKYKEEMGLMEAHLNDAKIKLEHRASIIENLKQQLEIEKKANDTLRDEHKDAVESVHINRIHVTNLEAEYKKSKEYWESNTKVLHDEIHRLKQQVRDFRLSAEGFEDELNKLKAKKKWYKFF